MLEFILCDDVEKHNSYLKKAIEKVLENKQLNGVISYVSQEPKDVLNYSKRNRCKSNVYILDIDFPGEMNGVELAEKIRENDVLAYIIFVSGHQEYSLLCYKVKAFDFLLKPLTFKIIDRCIANVFDDYNKIKKISNPIIPVKSGSKIHTVNVKDIIYVEKYNSIAIFHTLNGVIRTYASLDDIQQQIGDHGFYRCHKSFLVNLSQIEYISISQNYLFMKNKKKVMVSRSQKKELIEIVECRI